MPDIQDDELDAVSIGDLSTEIVGALAESMANDAPPRWMNISPIAYGCLADVLQSAHDQAAHGKGKARHNARNVSFDRQPILEIARMVGPGYPAGQAMKKTQEASGMLARGEYDAAEAELLGAINYLAAEIILIREQR